MTLAVKQQRQIMLFFNNDNDNSDGENNYIASIKKKQKKRIPEEWKSALIHPLHKKGNKADVNNYVGVPIPYKVLYHKLFNPD